MAAIIVGNDKKILSLFPAGDMLGDLTTGLMKAIHQDFKRRGVTDPKQEEIKRLFTFLTDWAITLRGDLKWGVVRIIDSFPAMLIAEAGGTRWEPPTRSVWIQQDGT